MKTKSLFIIAVSVLLAVCIFSCKKDYDEETTYTGTVVNSIDAKPFPDLEVKVTDGEHINKTEHTDGAGVFSILVRFNEINSKYYLLIGDSSCVPVRKDFKGFGKKEIDLGIIEVEGPKIPKLGDVAVSEITALGATIRSSVEDDGRATITKRGVCYSTKEYPDIDDIHTENGIGKGDFTAKLQSLEPKTMYYARAYATNRIGTSYSEQISFTTTSGEAVVSTDSVTTITANSARCYANVSSDGGFPITMRGVCWSKNPNPTTLDEIANEGGSNGSYICALRNLETNSVYYVRAFATNQIATSYGEQIKIQTLDGLAVVQIDSVGSISATDAKVYSTVLSDCGISVTARGVCWSKSQYPTIENEHTTVGKGIGAFTGNLTKLEVGTTYYVRAYATNATETAYSRQIRFTTSDGMPKVTTTTATNISATSATCGGNVTDDGTLTVTARGVCYGTTQYPTIEGDHTTDGKGKGTFTSGLTNLNDKTTYYYRAYATTDAGIAYGEQKFFTTADGSAKVTIGEVSEIKAESAIWTAMVTGDGGVEVTERGICYATSQYPTIADTHTTSGRGTGGFTSALIGLTPNTLYYVRAYATNAIGTAYSEQKQFTTASGLPIVNTSETTATSTTITSGGNITSDGDYTITARGVCYSTNNSTPTIDDNFTTAGLGIGEFSTIITNVMVNTTYYVRAYATNSIGTAYGDVITVTTGNGLPTVITTIIGGNVTETTAVGGGQVTDDGGYVVTAYGLCWNTLPYPTINDNKTTDGSGTGYFSSTITNIDITGENVYYVRAYAVNENGTSYGEQVKVCKENLEYKNLPRIEYAGYIYVLYKDMGAMSFSEANQVCEELVFAGYDDWQIPKNEALLHIMTYYKDGWYCEDGKSFIFIPIANAIFEDYEQPKYSADYFSIYGVCYYPVTHYEKQLLNEWGNYITYWWYYHDNPVLVSVSSSADFGSRQCRVRPVRKYKATE